MVKLIIFDLDGTLVDSKNIHYIALNMAIQDYDSFYIISVDDHLRNYDGLSTKQKLNKLTLEKGLPIDSYDFIASRKQTYTADLISDSLIEKDERICSILQRLRERGYKIYIASNCTWRNLITIASRKGFIPYLDWVVSNEDVKNPKPSPDIYLKCFERCHVDPSDVLIVEDSDIGKKAAIDSGARLLAVNSPSDITLKNLGEALAEDL